MKTLVVLAQHPQLAEAVENAVDSQRYRVVHRRTPEEAEPMLVHNLAFACIVDLDVGGVSGVWMIEKLRRRAPKCPVIAYASKREAEWEEEVYMLGVEHVFSKPLRPRMLLKLLEQIEAPSTRAVESDLGTVAPIEPVYSVAKSVAAPPVPASHSRGLSQDLRVLREFSSILIHSLDAEALVAKFLQMLRELMGVNRAAIFLKQPPVGSESELKPNERVAFRPSCTVGLVKSLEDSVLLGSDSGVGGYLTRTGRILRRDARDAADRVIQQEFDLVGAEVAVPIMGRDELLGMALLDCRVTGEPLLSSELELAFHLLEQVGLALSNIWMHDQLAWNSELLTDVLRELSSACLVVGPDLAILHANKSARRLFKPGKSRAGTMDFADLPQELGSKIYQVLKTGAAVPSFRYEVTSPSPSVFSVSIMPVHHGFEAHESEACSALLVMDDRSQEELLKQLEVDAANLRLIRSMADRMAHEVGNAMVPLSTHQQLLQKQYRDPEFRSSLDAALSDGVKRVTRLVSQMRYIARDSSVTREPFQLAELLEEAYADAQKYHSGKAPHLTCASKIKDIALSGDRAALKHAFTEILLNAIQANPADPRVDVRLADSPGGNGSHDLAIEVEDNGTGFEPEAAKKATDPFFTTRSVGLGLGLTASRRIIETHAGRVDIPSSGQSGHGLVRVSLPVEETAGSGVERNLRGTSQATKKH